MQNKKEKVQQALFEHFLYLREEAELHSVKPIDALQYARAMSNVCEAMVNISLNYVSPEE